MDTMINSIETSITLKIFKNRKDASYNHLYNSNLEKIPMKIFLNIDNFNPERLQETAITAYPLHDRPRGLKDIQSVKYHQKLIKENINISPIWLLLKNKKYTLLDGAHRIVAHHIENKKYIQAYVIKI